MSVVTATREYFLRAGDETLACSLDDAGESPPSVFCLHGGGDTHRHTVAYLSPVFRELGHTVVRFDFSGQGDSTGEMNRSSLQKRYQEAAAVLNHFGPGRRLVVVATSMAGAVAARLAVEFPVTDLILFCPAAYSRRAWNLEFGAGFTGIIREEDSFLETEAGELLKSYRGNALHVLGTDDRIIPPGVTQLFLSSLAACRRLDTVVLEDCPHPIHRWAEKHPAVRERIRNHVRDFLVPPQTADRSPR